MTNVMLMLRAIEAEPDDLTAECALTDALMEEQDMQRSEAEKYAARVTQAARDARDIAAAAALLKPGEPWHRELLRDILGASGLPEDVEAQIIVGPGDTAPRYHGEPGVDANGFWVMITVTVGSLWVVRHWRTNPSLCLMGAKVKFKKPRTR